MRVICAWHKEEKIHRVANEDGPKPSYIVETGSHWMYGSNAYVNVKMQETCLTRMASNGFLDPSFQ